MYQIPQLITYCYLFPRDLIFMIVKNREIKDPGKFITNVIVFFMFLIAFWPNHESLKFPRKK